LARGDDSIRATHDAKRGVSKLLQAAYIAADEGLWSDAERLLKEVIEIDPQFTDAYVKLGLIWETQDRLTEACAALERALELEERQPVLTLLGSVQRRLGDNSAALETVTRSLSLEPNDDEALHLSALLLRDTDPLKAVEHFERVLAVDPTHPYMHREMGLALWKAGRLDDAITAYRRAIEMDPVDAWAHNFLGDVLFASHRAEEAKREYVRATELAPENGLLWASVGRICSALGEYSEAEKVFRRGLTLAIDEPVLHREYGILLQKTGRLTSAKRYLNRALELNPNQGRARKTLAAIEANEKTITEA
jgi:tetratricopeptide (TPR) repeat protein